MLIAVDFDGTIVYDNHSMQIDGFSKEFIIGAKEVLRALKQAGNTLVLWTLRDHHRHYNDPHINAVMRFLKENDLDIFLLPKQLNGWENYHKFPAEMYIDDKAGFRGWHEVCNMFFGMQRTVEIFTRLDPNFNYHLMTLMFDKSLWKEEPK